MEESSVASEGRRRRPPRKQQSISDQTFSTETQNNPRVDSNSGPQRASDGSLQPQKPGRQRTRKPKKVVEGSNNGDHVASTPDGNDADTQLSTASQAPTWQQQQSFLNAQAADFQPNTNASSEIPADAAPGGKDTAKPKPKRKKKKPATPGIARYDVDSNNDEDNLLLGKNCDEELEGEAPHCLLCCTPMRLLSFGSCGHVTACGPCCLRLRMCYKRTDCSVCKSELPDVVIAPWRSDLPDFSFFLDHPEAVARSRPGQLGPGCILADKWQPKNRRPSSKLLHDLERSIGIACSVCDKSGARPFSDFKDLAAHLFERHGKHICGMCFREGRTFPLDLPLYNKKKDVKEHTAAVHPRCDFCRGRTFFDGDSLWTHMMEHHHRCHLCDPGPGGSDSWFADTGNLRSHLAADHFACDDGDCSACLVAFRTAEELRRHHIERHSARMPRWNPAAARPLQLDIQFVRRPAGAGVSAVFSSSSTSTGRGGDNGGGNNGGNEGRGARSGRGNRRNRGERQGNDGAAAFDGVYQQQGNNTNNNRFQRQNEFEHEIDGGIRIIDDDLGMLYEANNQFGSGNNSNQGAGGSGYINSLGFGGYSNGMMQNNGNSSRAEAFPSLTAAAAEVLADSSAASDTGGANRRPPPLVKHTVRCPCGRRVTYPVIEEGQPVPTVPCDAVCRLEGRKKNLADAFGVDDPDRHISSFERRAAVWSGMLLDAAKGNPTFVETIEKELQNFIANREVKRRALPAMPRAQRAVVYGMAEQYGLASAAMGVEPRRYIELFKTGDTAAGLPSKLLSKMALTVSEQEISAMLEASAGFPIRFLEIAPTTDLQYYLRRWEPRFKVEWQGGSQATVTFEKEEEMKDALDAFGGGIRGLFRIDRSWHPRTGVSTTEAARREIHVAPWAERNAGDGAGGSGGAAIGQWRAVAGFENKTRNATSQGDNGGNGGSSNTAAVPSGWAVIGGKKAVKPRVVAPAVGGSGEASRAQFSALSLADDPWN
jgi:E3 ubiquitin-protein ligase ZNF598